MNDLFHTGIKIKTKIPLDNTYGKLNYARLTIED